MARKSEVCFGTAMGKKMMDLNKARTTEDLVTFVKNTCESHIGEDVEQEAYFETMIETIKRSSFIKGMQFITNIILKGEGLGVI